MLAIGLIGFIGLIAKSMLYLNISSLSQRVFLGFFQTICEQEKGNGMRRTLTFHV